MLVSVIIPCYNVGAYVSECIDSVLAQTYSPLEIICVDNNSTDGTLNILKNYKERYNDKLIILSEKNAGASFARNRGLAVAKGEWVQFLDADDLLLPDKINHQMQLVSQNNNIAFIAAACLKQTFGGKKNTFNVESLDTYKALFITKLGNTCANLFNTKKVRDVGNWNETLKSSQETDLMFRLMKNDFDVKIDSVPLTIIRERESGQISQGNPINRWRQYIAIRLEIIKFLKANKADYFYEEKEFYFQNLFSQIRTLAKYDLKSANEIFKLNFEKHFVPTGSSVFSTYSILFKLVGFKNAEQIKKIIG